MSCNSLIARCQLQCIVNGRVAQVSIIIYYLQLVKVSDMKIITTQIPYTVQNKYLISLRPVLTYCRRIPAICRQCSQLQSTTTCRDCHRHYSTHCCCSSTTDWDDGSSWSAAATEHAPLGLTTNWIEIWMSQQRFIMQHQQNTFAWWSIFTWALVAVVSSKWKKTSRHIHEMDRWIDFHCIS